MKSIYAKLRENLEVAIKTGDETHPAFTHPEDKNNECYKYEKRSFNNQEFSMDWLPVTIKKREG
jgi:hypothetical protein